MSEAHANASDCPAEPQLPAFAAQPRRVIHCHGLSVPVPLSHHRPEHARHIFQLCDDIRSMGWTPVKDLPHNTTDSMALLSRPIPEHDPKIVAHLTCLRDAITGKDIDRNTELSGLFHPESSEAPNVDQRLLRALTAVSPDVPCHMVLEDGLALPGDPWTKTHCECSLAFVNLVHTSYCKFCEHTDIVIVPSTSDSPDMSLQGYWLATHSGSRLPLQRH